MFRKLFVLGLILSFVLAACAPGAPNTDAGSNEAMAEDTMEEDMSDEEMMEDDMADEDMEEGDLAMSEDDMMEEDMSDEEMSEEMEEDEMMEEDMMGSHFVVRIENVATDETLLLAPGAFAVHTEPGVIFTSGEADRGSGLEALAEDGDPVALAEALKEYMGVSFADVFTTPVDASEPAPIGPGGVYEFTFGAEPGSYLSFATMFVQSNDLFYAPDAAGIALFDETSAPISGDVTAQVLLWDAGTEVNQEPGVGADQPPRQSAPNTGADENGVVQRVADGFTYPDSVILVTITAK